MKFIIHYEDLDISSDEEPENHPAKRFRKNIYADLYSDNSSDEEENLNNEIVVTPPQNIQISPIVNKHLEYARAVVAHSRELTFDNKKNNNTSEREHKRTKCDNCNKTFLRISAHKCKGVKKTFI